MLNDEPHAPTLKVIRRITADEVLEVDEILDLARFLNENREARHAWPGSVLWKTLESVLEDGEISGEEMAALGSILEDIEAECRSFIGEAPTEEAGCRDADIADEEDVKRVDAGGFRLPSSVVGISTQTEAGRLYAVNLAGPTCNCDEWREHRASLPEGNPGRICRHVANALHERLETPDAAEWPAAFRGMVAELAEVFRGTAPDAQWRELRVNARDYLLALAGEDWAHVYGPGAAGSVERFSYSRQKKRWFCGSRPADAAIIAGFVDSLTEND